MNNDSYLPPPPAEQLSPLAAETRRGGRVVGAALLVGALAGGAAGFGGAALLHETSPPTSTVAARSPLTVARSAGNVTVPGSTEAAAAKALPSVVKIYASGASGSGSGSGIVLTSTGQILTNNHVVELALHGGKLAVTFNNGSSTRATIIGRDPLTDLAMIKAHGVTNATPAVLGNSRSLKVGQQVVAVGAPYGLESTVTTGIVSALNRPVTTQGESGNSSTVFPAIQTDAAINPGNSGGPLINMHGQVVGINSAIKTTSSSITQQSGSIGLGFSIPINEAIPIVRELRRGQPATHARIGVTVGDATDSVGLPGGALIHAVQQGTAASRAGLQSGQVITKVGKTLVSDANSLVATVRSYRPGDTVRMTVMSSNGRGQTVGSPHPVTVTLGSE